MTEVWQLRFVFTLLLYCLRNYCEELSFGVLFVENNKGRSLWLGRRNTWGIGTGLHFGTLGNVWRISVSWEKLLMCVIDGGQCILQKIKEWTISDNTVLQLMFFDRRARKWDVVSYMDIFFTLRNDYKSHKECRLIKDANVSTLEWHRVKLPKQCSSGAVLVKSVRNLRRYQRRKRMWNCLWPPKV